jgi:hypothetical protein
LLTPGGRLAFRFNSGPISVAPDWGDHPGYDASTPQAHLDTHRLCLDRLIHIRQTHDERINALQGRISPEDGGTEVTGAASGTARQQRDAC